MASNQNNKSTESVEVRRAPKYRPFLITGAAVGLVLALVLFLATGQSQTTDALSVLGILILAVTLVGAFTGVISAYLVDRRSLSNAKTTQATREDV
jgi:Na+/melibiose symporter-like transporter